MGMDTFLPPTGGGQYVKKDRRKKRAAKDAENAQAIEDSLARQAVITQTQNLARERRQRYMEKYAPLEAKLAQQAKEGINPDYAAIRQQAVDDVGQSYDRGVGSFVRDQSRYGLAVTPEIKEQLGRGMELNRTKAQVFGSNSAADSAKMRAEELNQTRGIQALSLGLGLPTQAAAGMSGAARGYGFSSEYNANNAMAQSDDDAALANAAGAIAGSFRDGGIVRKPVQLKTNDYIIPAAVVQRYGAAFFDKLVEQFS